MEPAWQIQTTPAACITLDRQPEKWRKFAAKNAAALRSLPQLERFSGVDGRTVDILKDPRLALRTRRDLLDKRRYLHEDIDSQGAVGCFLSHATLWERLARGEFGPVLLVFEDDVDLPATFVSDANAIIASSPRLSGLPGSVDLWLLGASWIELVTPIPSEKELYRLGHRFWGTQAYVITQALAVELLAQAFPVSCHVDAFLGIFARVFNRDLLWHSRMNLWQASWDTQRMLQPLSLNTSNTQPLCGDLELSLPLNTAFDAERNQNGLGVSFSAFTPTVAQWLLFLLGAVVLLLLVLIYCLL